MITFTILDEARNVVGSGTEIGETYRIYRPDFEGGQRDFENLSDVLEATGGYVLQTLLFPAPIPIYQIKLFAEVAELETDARQLNMFEGDN